MAAKNTILRLQRTDKGRQHLLVQVSKVGNKALDLKLIGTEHDHLYHAQLEESKVKSLQANSFSGDLTEWKAILKYALLHERPNGQIPDFLQGLETVATITGKDDDEDKIMTITIRKNIAGITQRLGEIKLKQDDGPVISIFEWVDSAVATADSMRTELETLQASMEQQSEQVASLNKQLDDLVKAKKEHEEELLAKFTALLNAKKLKIRDQQRLLAGAQVDPEAAGAVGDSRDDDGTSRKSGGSKKGKRKAETVDEVEDAEMNDDEEEEDERPQETPPASDDDATEDEDDLDAPAPTATSSRGRSQMEIDEPEEAPPSRRELPSRSQQSKSGPTPQHNNDDDDETDDEL